MIFSSLEFFVFLGVLLCALRLAGPSRREGLLLAASYVFYGWWDARFCLLILASTLVDFYVGRRIFQARDGSRKRAWLIVSLSSNLGLLGYFKYANFFVQSFSDMTGVPVGQLDLVLPVGISFFTFQTMSYTIDIHRGDLEPEPSFARFALFVAFFPQLVAGPIVRASEFLPQLSSFEPLRRSNLRRGLETFARGFVKKVLFADTLAILVDPVFAGPAGYSSATAWLALFAYSAQIYYDFSGYSDMAIGVGRMLGYELPPNFAHPYVSRSLTEFWRRWHISLSSWLRDYLYIPLGGNRLGRVRTYVNLLTTMVLGGLWHGASWNFVIWGLLHGIGLAVHRWWSRTGLPTHRPRLPPALGWVATHAFVMFCWVWFRAPDAAGALAFLERLALGRGGMDWFHVPSLVVLLVAAALHLRVSTSRTEASVRFDLSTPRGVAVVVAAMVSVLLFAPLDVSPFIYFQF